MRRRDFISLLSGAVVFWPTVVKAQGAAKRPLVAILSSQSRASVQPIFGGFLQGMRELGHLDGQTIDFEYRNADGVVTHFPALAEELVRLKPDVIVTAAVNGALACKQATSSIPIVAIGLVD